MRRPSNQGPRAESTTHRRGRRSRQLSEKAALALLDAFDHYAAALSSNSDAFRQDLAREMGVNPDVLPEDKLVRIGELLDQVDREGGSREMREVRIRKVVDDAIADLLMVPAVQRSRKAAARRLNRIGNPDADIVLAEQPAALKEVRQRWPNSKRVKTAVVDNIKARLAEKGRRVSCGRIASLVRLEGD